MSKRVSVTIESDTGRNQRFRDNTTGHTMSRSEFVSRIEQGAYDKFHVRIVNGVKTPVSNPDRKTTIWGDPSSGARDLGPAPSTRRSILLCKMLA